MTDEIHFGVHSASETFDSFDSTHASTRESNSRDVQSAEHSDVAHGDASPHDSDRDFDDAARAPRRDADSARRSADEVPTPVEPELSDSDPVDEPSTDSTVEAAADDAAPKRRRRGSRGGRRRRGRREGEPAEAVATEVDPEAAAVEPLLPGEDDAFDSSEAPVVDADEPNVGAAESVDGAAAPRRRRSRRGRGGRGRGGDAAEKTEATRGDAAPAPARGARATRTSEASSPRSNAQPPARVSGARGVAPVGTPRSGPPRGSVPREIDALDDDADLALDAVPADDGAQPAHDGEVSTAVDDGKRRRRGNRGGRRRKTRAATGARADSNPPGAGSSRPNPSRSGGRSAQARNEKAVAVEIESIPGEDDDLPLVEIATPLAPESDARGGRRRRGRGRGREAQVADPESDPDAPRVVPESERRSMILVNATDPEEQRVAVMEDGKITDFLMTVKDQDTLVNDIYRGRVVNLEPAIGAAFIDFGQGRNGFLHTSDVLTAYGEDDFDLDKLLSTQIDPEEWDENSGQPAVSADIDDADDDEERPSKRGAKGKDAKNGRGKRRFEARPRLPITDLLEKGQTVVVQVTKDAIGDKGPTLTTYISIPGRYLVLMPSMSRTGVSRKIEDEKERRRLKRILQTLEVPKGMGVIVRTAGVGHSKNEIKRDLDYLVSLWTAFGKKLHQGHGPAALYRESDVAIKTMRDLYSSNTKAVLVDDPEVQRQILEFTEKLMPEDVGRVQLHDGAKPLFQHYNVEPDFERIFQRRIELASGGSIVFDQAEALVAIDVNSGRTRSDGFDFEDIALKTNLEAAPEIARQMRLRDLGGIIVVDFIDMMKMSNIRAVEKAFKEALEGDRARSKVGRISQFGLLEMTRQRLGPGMDKKVFHHCPRCRGTGRIRTVNSRAAAILRRLSSALTHKGFQTVEVRAHPEVVAYLKSDCSDHLRALEYRFQKDVKLFDAPEQSEDSVLRYVRPDGREVRPGGRRKR